RFQVVTPFAPGPARFMQLLPAGAQWAGGLTTTNPVPVAFRSFAYTGPSPGSTITYRSYPSPYDSARPYVLFSFDNPGCGGGTCYGWMQLQLSFPFDGPNLDVVGWAYQDD